VAAARWRIWLGGPMPIIRNESRQYDWACSQNLHKELTKRHRRFIPKAHAKIRSRDLLWTSYVPPELLTSDWVCEFDQRLNCNCACSPKDSTAAPGACRAAAPHGRTPRAEFGAAHQLREIAPPFPTVPVIDSIQLQRLKASRTGAGPVSGSLSRD